MNLVLVPLQRLVQILLVMLVGLVAAFFIVLFSTRQLVNEQLRTQIGQVATEASGLCIEVGEVRGDWWAGLNLRDVKIHETEKPTSGVLINVPLVQVDYSIISLMGPRPRPIRVDAYHANLVAIVGKDHLMRFKPLQKPLEKNPKPLPPVDIVIHSSHVAYEDQGARKPFVAELTNVSGEGQIRGYDLNMNIQAVRDTDTIHADVHYDFKHPGGQVHATAHGLAVPYFVNRFGYAPEYEMTAGKADIDAHVSWQDPLDPKMTSVRLAGKVKFYDAATTVKNTERPVEHIRGEATLHDQAVTLDKVQADIDGMPLEGTGEVSRLLEPQPTNMPDPILHVSVVAPQVALEKLSDLFPGLKDLHLAGEGRIHAQVTGTANDARVALRGFVPEGRYGKEPVSDFFIAANYKKGEVDLPRIRLTAAGGTGEGTAWVGLPEDEKAPIPYRVGAHFQRVDVASLITRYSDKPLPVPVTGRLALNYQLAGVGLKAEAKADATVTGGSLAGKPVQRFAASYHAKDGRWEMPALSLQWDGTALSAKMTGSDRGDFALDAQLPRAELAQLARLSPRPLAAPISGTLVAEAHLEGLLKQPASWQGRAKLDLHEAMVDRQAIPQAGVRLSLKNNHLHVEDGRARLLGGSVDWHGEVAPAIAQPPDALKAHLAVAVHGLDAARSAYLPPDMRALEARADGRFEVTVAQGAWHVAGTAVARQVRHPAWGHLDAVEATLAADPQEVHVSPLTLRQGPERVTAVGDLRLGAHPSLDLRVRAHNAQVATLLSTVDWRRVEQALNPRAAAARLAIGPERPKAALPAAAIAETDGGVSLRNGLERWLAWHKEPLDRPAAAPTLLPFWEGTRGRLSLEAHLTGPVAQPRAEVTADVRDLDLFDRHIDEAHTAFVWSADRLALDRLRVREGGRVVLTGGGVISDRPTDTLVLAAHDLDLGWSRRMLLPYKMRLDGHAAVMLRVRGPWKSPRFAADGALTEGAFERQGLDPVAFERIEAELAYERGRLAIRRASLRQDGKEATVSGTLPVGDGAAASTSPLDLAFRLEDGNLGIVNLFSQNQFRWLGGKGFAEIRLGGTMLHPTVAGQIKLDEGRFAAKGLETPVEHVQADVVLASDQVQIKGLHGHYGGGDVDVQGDVTLDQFKPDKVNLTAVARPFRLQLTNDYYQGTVEANLRLTGSVAQPQLSGLVALRDGVLRLKDTKDANALPKDPMPLWLKGLQISLGPNLYLKNALIDVAVTTQQRQGYLQVDGPIAAPRPSGVVILESGTIRPLSNPFRIVDGRVEFHGEQVRTEDDLMSILAPDAGADPTAGMNAKLDIQARTTVYDYKENEPVNIQAIVTGSLEKMEMRFTSEPMRSEQQILDLLSKKQVLTQTFGGKLDGGQVIVKEVGGLVSSNIEELISPYTLALRNALNLQTFRVELVPDYNHTSTASVAGFKPALTLETRPLMDRLSFGSRLVAGQMYSTSPTAMLADRTYFGLNWKFNRYFSMQYRVDPVIDQANERVLNQTVGFKAQISY